MPKLATSDPFLVELDAFYGMWSALEAMIDYVIGQFLKIPHEETHILTAGMEFGRKANLLKALLARSDHADKAKIREILTKIQNESKRNIFTHSIMRGDEDTVTFVHRKMDGVYSGTATTFTGPEFKKHVATITTYASTLKVLLRINENDYQAFGRAAESPKSSG